MGLRNDELELMMLKTEMKSLSTLQIPIQVASKMELNSQIEKAENALQEIEKKLINEEE